MKIECDRIRGISVKTLGICTSREKIEDLNEEKRFLYEEGIEVYDQVLLIDTQSVYYKFVCSEQKLFVIHKGESLVNLTTLIIRSTKNREMSTAILAHSLDLCGCDILDNLSRFTASRSSKLLTTLNRFKLGIGIDSFFAFDLNGAMSLINELYNEERFPLVAKPISGCQGRDVVIIENLKDAIIYIDSFFANRVVDEPLFLQKYIDFKAEYRVLVVYGKALGIAQKHRTSGGVAANAAQGGRFSLVESKRIIEYVTQNVSDVGILGVDIAVDDMDQLHIIESNRAPLWKEFELATGINVAKAIITHAKRRWKK